MSTSSKRRKKGSLSATLGTSAASMNLASSSSSSSSDSSEDEEGTLPHKIRPATENDRSQMYPRLKHQGPCDLRYVPPLIILKTEPVGVKTKLGRALDNDYKFNLTQISRHHCEFSQNPDKKWMVKNLSVNGLKVNGTLVLKGQEKEMNDLDIISIIPTDNSPKYKFYMTDTKINKEKKTEAVAEEANKETEQKEKEKERIVIKIKLNQDVSKMGTIESQSPVASPSGVSKRMTELERLKAELKKAETELGILEFKKQENQFDSILDSFENPGKSTKSITTVEALEKELKEEEEKSDRVKEKAVKTILVAMKSYFRCPECDQIIIQALICDCGHCICEYCFNKANEDRKNGLKCPHCFEPILMSVDHYVLRNLIDKAFISVLPTSWIKDREKVLKEREEEVTAYNQELKEKKKKLPSVFSSQSSVVTLDDDDDDDQPRPGPSSSASNFNPARATRRSMNSMIQNDSQEVEMIQHIPPPPVFYNRRSIYINPDAIPLPPPPPPISTAQLAQNQVATVPPLRIVVPRPSRRQTRRARGTRAGL